MLLATKQAEPQKSYLQKDVNVAAATLNKVYAFGQALAALSEWSLDQIAHLSIAF